MTETHWPKSNVNKFKSYWFPSSFLPHNISSFLIIMIKIHSLPSLPKTRVNIWVCAHTSTITKKPIKKAIDFLFKGEILFITYLPKSKEDAALLWQMNDMFLGKKKSLITCISGTVIQFVKKMNSRNSMMQLTRSIAEVPFGRESWIDISGNILSIRLITSSTYLPTKANSSINTQALSHTLRL